MPQASDHAVVLRLSDYSETSQIATLFVRETGLLRVIAKGARRGTKTRAAVGLDLLELGDAAFSIPRGDAQLGVLTEWVQRDAFLGTRTSLLRLNSALYAAEAVSALTQEQDPHADLFDALLRTLRELADPRREQPQESLVRFQQELLREVGFEPVLDRCASCGRARPPGSGASFSSAAGGLLCRTCAPRHTERQSVRASTLDSAPLGGDARAWFALLDYHLSHVAGRRLATAPALHQALARGGR